MKWFIKCLRHYADFSGRARRKEYWMFTLFNVIFLFAWAFVMAIVASNTNTFANEMQLQLAIQLSWTALVGLPGMAVAVRRLHDLGKSGWMALIALIPLIGGIWLLVLMVTPGQSGPNRFGADPKTSPETFPERAKLTSAGVVIIVGVTLSLISNLCAWLIPEYYDGRQSTPFAMIAQNIVANIALITAGILLVASSGRGREHIRPTLWIVLVVTGYFGIINFSILSSNLRGVAEGVYPIRFVFDIIVSLLHNLSLVILAAVALFAPKNRAAIRGAAVAVMTAGGVSLVKWTFDVVNNIDSNGFVSLMVPLFVLSTIGWIVLAWTFFSRRETPAESAMHAQPLAPAAAATAEEHVRQTAPTPTPAPAATPATQPADPVVTADEDTMKKLNTLIVPFTQTTASLFYDAEAEKRKAEALKEILAEGPSGQKFLLDFLLRDVTISGEHFNLRPYGELAAGEWNKKRDIVLALSGASDRVVIDKLAEILLLKGRENQFYTVFQPAVAETLGRLKEYGALEKYIVSGQNVPAVLLSKDILRLHKAGVEDKPENMRDENGRTPLYKAVGANDAGQIKKLLADGADIDAVCSRGDSLGETALYLAVADKHVELAKLLLENNANPSAAAWNGTFPLQRAAAMGNSELVKLLLDHGADKEQKTLTGKTALMWAEQNGHSDIAALLR